MCAKLPINALVEALHTAEQTAAVLLDFRLCFLLAGRLYCEIPAKHQLSSNFEFFLSHFLSKFCPYCDTGEFFPEKTGEMPTTIVVFILYSILLYSTLFYSTLRARRKSRKNGVIGVITCFKSNYC